MLSKRFQLLAILLLLLAHLANSQAPKTPPKTVNYKQLIENAIQAHVRAYFGDDTVPKETLKVATINGASFDDLKHKLSVGRGAVEYWGGRAIPEAGSSIKIDFLDPSQDSPQTSMLLITAIANGKGGVQSFDAMEFTEGTRVTLKTGATFVFRAGRWIKN